MLTDTGTHIAGAAAAQAGNGVGGVGVAFNAKIMPIRAAQYSGALSSTDISEAIMYAWQKGADVINMSFALPYESMLVKDALTEAFWNICTGLSSGKLRQAHLVLWG